MIIKGLTDESFTDYKKASMVLAFPKCSFKCEKECGIKCCQNSTLANSSDIEIKEIEVVKRYLNNNLTSAIVCAGLEPFDTWSELIQLIEYIRISTNDDIVIFTGYNKEEIEHKLPILRHYKNIIVKFGRYIPDKEKHFDEILGVELASPNQYAERIS